MRIFLRTAVGSAGGDVLTKYLNIGAKDLEPRLEPWGKSTLSSLFTAPLDSA
jgi:hypothetical protein